MAFRVKIQQSRGALQSGVDAIAQERQGVAVPAATEVKFSMPFFEKGLLALPTWTVIFSSEKKYFLIHERRPPSLRYCRCLSKRPKKRAGKRPR